MVDWSGHGKNLKTGLSYGSCGLEMALSVGLGWYLGDKLDGRFQTGPWIMIAGVILGSVAGFLSLLRTMRRADKEPD